MPRAVSTWTPTPDATENTRWPGLRPLRATGPSDALASSLHAPATPSPVADLRYEDVANAVDTMAKTYAHNSVKATLTLVRSVLTHGVRHHGLPRNVAEGIAPQGKAAVVRPAYTPEQLRALSRAAEDDPEKAVAAAVQEGGRALGRAPLGTVRAGEDTAGGGTA